MRHLRTLLVGVTALILTACGGGSVQSPDFTSELQSIRIDPTTGNLDVDETLSFTAFGQFAQPPGSNPPLRERSLGEGAVTWTSSNPEVATIDENGLATGVGSGTTQIRASARGRNSRPATLTVFEPNLISLEVTPDPASRPIGTAQQFIATGTFGAAPGSPNPTFTRPVSDVVWSVANAAGETSTAAVAIIDADSGVATGRRLGSAIVTATSGGISDSAVFNVTAPELVAINIAPQDPSIPLGTTQVLRATGVFSDGAMAPIVVDWSSDDTDVVTVAPASGPRTTATPVAEGTATVTASQTTPSGVNVTATTDITVVAVALQRLLRVDPPIGRVTPGRSIEFVAIGEFSDGTEAPIDDADITWRSSDNTFATINEDGVATGVERGQVQITATRKGTSETATAILNVTSQACTIPLQASDGAILTEIRDPLACLLCSFQNTNNIINANPFDFGTIRVPLGLLGADAAIRVRGVDNPGYTVPFAAGGNAGFIVGQPTGQLLLAELGSQLLIRTLRNGVVQQESSDGVTPLRLDLLGQVLAGETETVLVSLQTNTPYDAIELSFNSGVATALSTVRVFQACATSEPPQPTAALRAVARIEPTAVTVTVGATRDVVTIGEFASNTEASIPDADINWSSDDQTIATVDANGVITGVATGTATITATLKPGVTSTELTRSAVATVTVVGDLCVTPLRASDGATVDSDKGGLLCPICTANNIVNVIDDITTNFASLSVDLGLGRPSVSITVSASPRDEFDGGDDAGFLIARPTGKVVQAEVGSRFRIETLLDGEIQESSSPNVPLRVDLLGVGVDGAGDRALVTVATSSPYDALRLTFIGGLVAGGLQNSLTSVNVFQACAATNPAPAPPPP